MANSNRIFKPIAPRRPIISRFLYKNVDNYSYFYFEVGDKEYVEKNCAVI